MGFSRQAPRHIFALVIMMLNSHPNLKFCLITYFLRICLILVYLVLLLLSRTVRVLSPVNRVQLSSYSDFRLTYSLGLKASSTFALQRTLQTSKPRSLSLLTYIRIYTN